MLTFTHTEQRLPFQSQLVNMLSLQTLLVLLSAASAVTCAETVHAHEREARAIIKPSSESGSLLDSVKGGWLHETLKELHPAFGAGVFENDEPALAAVHAENPSLASKIVSIARVELAKRQNASTTSVEDVTTSTAVVVVDPTTTSSATDVVTTTSPSMTDATTSAVVETSTSAIVLTDSSTTETSSVVVISTSSSVAQTSAATVSASTTSTDDITSTAALATSTTSSDVVAITSSKSQIMRA